jgi:very-short-patch-repair endonuclease
MRRTAEDKRAFITMAAAHMAANPTPAEEAMWKILEPLKFKRQVALDGYTKNGLNWLYILDFYHPVLKLCVEVDGGIHKRQRGRDRRRDRRLAGEGIKTIRIKNADVLKWPDTVRETIEGVLRANGQ